MLAIAFATLGLTGLSGCVERTHSTAAVNERLERGRAIYNYRCYFCHGYSGDAKTVAANHLTPPPRSFVAPDASALSLESIMNAVSLGRPGTAMKSFSSILAPDDISAVSHFVLHEFVRHQRKNTRYHTAENGWPNHDRHAEAFPFATGVIGLDKPFDELNAAEQRGRNVFLSFCTTCHEGKTSISNETVVWKSHALSYPRFNYDHREPEVDANTSATPFHIHDVAPKLKNLTSEERLGERIFQKNCAFCHAADGTGRNWIGSFLEPHPRDLTDPAFMSSIDRKILAQRIRDGLPNSSMPAWGDVLTESEIQAVVTYIHRAFHPAIH